MTIINHQAIAASAGSGKTFQLAHRYLRLMASGIRPDRINALTFSRKAAGEIFDSIVKYLSEAAASPDKAKTTAGRIGQPGCEQSNFLKMLREFLEDLHRLHIGTLDSFSVSVIRAFPMELGVPGHFQVLDNEGAAARAARREVLASILSPRYVNRSAQRQFLEAFKQATFGQEEKESERNLDAFVSRYRGCYQILPGEDDWGQKEAIWPEGSPWFVATAGVGEAAEMLRALIAADQCFEDVRDRWDAFIDAVRSFDSRSRWSRDIEYLLEKLLEDIDGLRDGRAAVKIGRKEFRLSPEQSSLALALVTHVMQTEIGTALERTRGLYSVLDQYEQFYDAMLRHQGKLTFDDVQYLLTTANEGSGGTVLSRLTGQDQRLYIDYRLDSRLDHWLLDEFQDTSDLQWEVLSNLIDEVVQDSSGERSFFYVGDVKQAIYGWRGGNARLFGQVLEKYPGRIEQVPLNVSFRSSQPVIDTVNRVFTHLPPDLPQDAVNQWVETWETHCCEQRAVPEHGYAALLEPDSINGQNRPTAEDRFRIVAHLLEEIDPSGRGLSVGILVRSNDTGKEITDYLRGQAGLAGMNIVHEGRGGITDNPVVALLLSLVKLASHPGDTLAWRHLEMSPLGPYLKRKGLDHDRLPLEALQEIESAGFQSLLRRWGTILETIQPLDGFGLKRLNDLIDAAGEFDSGGSRDCDEFGQFIEGYEIHAPAAECALRVMTVHQSKGLGFDIVILPDLQTRSITRADEKDIDLVIAREPDSGEPAWALKMPRRMVALGDPVLAEQMHALDARACYDALCVQYVALTRARYAMYMITSFSGKTATAVTPATLLRTQLHGHPNPPDGPRLTINGEEVVCLYEAGEREWYSRVCRPQPEAATTVPLLPSDFARQPSQRKRLVPVSPSTQTGQERNAAALFDRAHHDAAELGNAVHELLGEVSWLDWIDVDSTIAGWRKRSTAEEELKNRAEEHFRKAVRAPEFRKALTLSEADTEIWRERSFEVVLGDRWVTGTFDRVTIVRDAQGVPKRATIIDFKTEDISDEAGLAVAARRYRPQLALYGQALARMLGIDHTAIALRLVFTGSGQVVQCDVGARPIPDGNGHLTISIPRPHPASPRGQAR